MKVEWYQDRVCFERSGGRKEWADVWKADIELPAELSVLGDIELMVWPNNDGECVSWCWEIEHRDTGASVHGETTTREGVETAKQKCEATLPGFIKELDEANG